MALSTQRDPAFLPSPDQSAPQPNYDVFLSFRGEDTRLSFVSHLYHELQHMGIKTFKDDPKLERGTHISSELFIAIEKSGLAIVVLSPNYASSSWCLDELTKILQCMNSKSTVLPVFYHVDPSDLRKQTGSFACVFTEHEERFSEDSERVKIWRDALTEVASLSGFDSKNESERKFVEKIVDWVWDKVDHRFNLLDSTELVGMKFIREQVDLLLAHPTDDVRFIGIWGMGGIGKTTIAQLVYDNISTHFELSSFLPNVREVSQRGNFVDLQRQLLSPILKDQITRVRDEKWGTSVIKKCLYNKKVLLILDDVSESSQLEKLAGEKDWFGKGSIIIITTRDRRLLDQHDIHIQYEVEALGDDDALELFSRNAFRKKDPEEGFLELSKGFVNYAKGLPLALKLFWVNECQSLEQLPDLSKLISLVNINIANCTSLKMSPHLSSNCSLVDMNYEIDLCSYNCANCFLLVDNEGCDSIILNMLQRYLQLQLIPTPFDYSEIVTPGRKIPEWFSNQSLGDFLTVELPTTWMGIALCAVFEVQAALSNFQFICFTQGMRSNGVFSKKIKIGDVVSYHLWVIYVPRKQFEKICGQIKVWFRTQYFQDIMWGHKKSCVKCGFRLVHEQDVEQVNHIMMNKSITQSTTTCPTKSADAQGQLHDDRKASPSGSGSSHQKSLFCNTYALSEEAYQDELNDVVDEAQPRKRKKIHVIGTNL